MLESTVKKVVTIHLILQNTLTQEDYWDCCNNERFSFVPTTCFTKISSCYNVLSIPTGNKPTCCSEEYVLSVLFCAGEQRAAKTVCWDAF